MLKYIFELFYDCILVDMLHFDVFVSSSCKFHDNLLL